MHDKEVSGSPDPLKGSGEVVSERTHGTQGDERCSMATPTSFRFWRVGLAFLLIVPATAHILFSWMGMNPTDDGAVFVLSRRLLDGQVPHLDFISIRPVGTGILFAPVLFLGGEYTIWISRYFVWFQFACIAWIWTIILPRLLRLTFHWTELLAIALMAFAFTAHNWLLTPWHTVDGLWISSIGLFLCLSPRAFCKFLGYLLVGSAALFKQNFLAVGPVFLIVLQDWRQIRYWMAVFLPVAAYGVCAWALGALPDAILQLSSHGELLETGIGCYLESRPFLIGAILMSSVMWMGSGKGRMPFVTMGPQRLWILATTGLCVVLAAGAACLASGTARNFQFAFGLFGMVAGGLLFGSLQSNSVAAFLRAGILVFWMGWVSSISLGWNSPVFGTGLAVVLFICIHRSLLPYAIRGKPFRFINQLLLFVTAAVVLVGFSYGRCNHIFKERPAHELQCPLDDVLAGGKKIMTNPETFGYMQDLKQTIDDLHGREYAVIPDCAIHWIKAGEKNPLSIDWPQGVELSNKALYRRVIKDLLNFA